MKKLFTLFALLSVGLSAWAQDGHYKFLVWGPLQEAEEEEFYGPKKEYFFDDFNSFKQYIYLENGFYETFIYEYDEEWEVWPEGEDYIAYSDFSIDYGGAWFLFHGTYNAGEPDIEESYDFEIKDDDSKPFYSYMNSEKNTVYNPLYTRQCTKQWGTLCLPFRFAPDHYSNVSFYSFDRVDGDVMYFNIIEDEISAGQPVIFKINDGSSTLTISEGGEEPYELALNPIVSTSSTWNLQGTFKEAKSGSNTYYYIANRDGEDGVFYGTNITVPPYRAWFTGPTPSGAPLRIEVDETEGLQFVEQEDGTVKVSYDLQGRKLNEARKGLMIENGKVIMVK